MRSLITFTLGLGILAACGDKEEEDTAVEVEEAEQTEETEQTEDPSDTSSAEETEDTGA